MNDVLICELKATSTLTKADEVQVVNYLTATNRDVGLLLNFGAGSLQFKRKYRPKPADVMKSIFIILLILSKILRV